MYDIEIDLERFNNIDHVKNLHMTARDAYLLWKDIGKHRLGVVYDVMRQARSNFKHALIVCKKKVHHY